MLKGRDTERSELHRTIWDISCSLRGAIDGWDFKQYILGMLFYRYISENNNILNIPSECLFHNFKKNSNNISNLSEELKRIFKSIEISFNGKMDGIFDDIDLNSNKLGATVKDRNARLVKLINGISEMDVAGVDNCSIDAFGDAYEYLMGMYASNAGKSGGEYFTPQEVSELLTKIAVYGKDYVSKIYDPSCGSGSLLLKAAKILGKSRVRNFYGQEINLTTYNLCRINMFLHGVDCSDFDIRCGDTLIQPSADHEKIKPFDVIVSNPPYSIKWEGKDNPTLINDYRFAPAGVLAPKSKADMAFIMHCLSWLAPDGVAAIVCFPGVMYRGGTEKQIRQYLVDNNFVDAVIYLPENLFYGTSISTCILVLKKSKTDSKTFFIDASKEFVKAKNSNKLSEENINNIVNIYGNREEKQYFSRLVSINEISKNDYNLSVSTYVEKEDTREKIDIVELERKIKEVHARNEQICKEIDELIQEIS